MNKNEAYLLDIPGVARDVYARLAYHANIKDDSFEVIQELESFITDMLGIMLYNKSNIHIRQRLSKRIPTSHYLTDYFKLKYVFNSVILLEDDLGDEDNYQGIDPLASVLETISTYDSLASYVWQITGTNSFNIWKIEREAGAYILINEGDYRILVWHEENDKAVQEAQPIKCSRTESSIKPSIPGYNDTDASFATVINPYSVSNRIRRTNVYVEARIIQQRHLKEVTHFNQRDRHTKEIISAITAMRLDEEY
jgi:hypothetical protein